MRIAFINPPYETVPTLSEGTAASSLTLWATEIANRLSSNHSITVFSPGDGKHPQGVIHDQGVQFHYTSPRMQRIERKLVNGLQNVEAVLNYPRRKRPIVATRWFFPAYAAQVAQALCQEQWDVIHIHDFPQFAPAIRAAAPQARTVLHMHCLRLSQFDPVLMRQYLQATDLVLVIAQFIADAFVESFPERADRCHILKEGLALERFLTRQPQPSGSKKLQLLFVGRISPEKGVHILLKAFEQVARRYPQLELNIVGAAAAIGYSYLIPMSDDPLVRDLHRFYTPIRKRDNYLPQLQAMIPPELAHRVHFIGSVPNSQVQEYFQQATAFIFPSVWKEPFGIALVEGMASGVPVIATLGGGNAELVAEGKAGFIVERNDPNALAEAISRIIEEPELARTMVQAAQQRISSLFTWDQCAGLLLDYYQNLLQQPAAQPAHPPLSTVGGYGVTKAG
ncbi:MAG: glycosyltransferase family 4 protein [Anaerolineae bacterium]|nr:glycosyltransferase family 4 protein [Anaerolineae bacterium]